MTWIDAIATCFTAEDDGDTKKKVRTKGRPIAAAAAASDKKLPKLTSVQRLFSFSDLSNPGSPSYAEDLSFSLGSNICVFTTNELRSITNNYSSSSFLGEGGFGPVYKGLINEKLRPGVLKPQMVAVKLLDLEGFQGHREWLAEIIYLGQLKHPHVVKLIGYCCEEEQRLLVYEFMQRGSLENHLFKRLSTPLPWAARLKIAVGAAEGLAFLHGLEKPIIYRDFKASNILLDSDFTAKLSDFGLAKDGPEAEETHVSTRVVGTPGYAAPEYVMTGHLTVKSDVYSFGVVLLELLTGLRSMEKGRGGRKQNLVEWKMPYLNDSRKLNQIMDPNLDGQYSVKGAQKAAALAYQCLARSPKKRPTMSTVVETLKPLQELKDVAIAHFVYTVPQENGKGDEKDNKQAAKENGRSTRTRNGQHGHRCRSPISVTTNSWSKNSASPKHRSKEARIKH